MQAASIAPSPGIGWVAGPQCVCVAARRTADRGIPRDEAIFARRESASSIVNPMTSQPTRTSFCPALSSQTALALRSSRTDSARRPR